ncbi:MAG: amidohydrolase family protein [Microbacterium sp.]
MSRADAHVHLSSRRSFCAALKPGTEVEAYLEIRARAGITHSLVVGYERGEHEGNSDDIRRIAQTHKGLHTTAFLETHGPPAPRLLSDALAKGHAGWSVYLDGDGLGAWRTSDRAALRGLDGGVLSVNVSARDIEALHDLLRTCGDVPVFVSHLGLPGPDAADWALDGLTALASDPRVHVKVSGLYAIDARSDHPSAREVVAVAVDAFGVDRLLWGSDFSPVLDAVADPVGIPSWLPGLVGSSLPGVLGANLLRLLEVRA